MADSGVLTSIVKLRLCALDRANRAVALSAKGASNSGGEEEGAGNRQAAEVVRICRWQALIVRVRRSKPKFSGATSARTC
ncbi:hypothetical protein MRX96_007462 [Rhipicephalus microplus]